MTRPVLNVRGTSGSGKSTLIRGLLDRYPEREPFYIEGRKRPLYYVLSGAKDLPDIAVVGHYETACGGCDTITHLDTILETVRKLAQTYPVVFEGLLVSAEFKRTLALKDEHGLDLSVFHIEIPLEQCVESVNARRREKNPDAPDVNPKGTENKWKVTRRTCERLREARVRVFEGNRAACAQAVLEVLRYA